MSVQAVQPLRVFNDIDGSPLHNGYIYIGTAGLDAQSNPITVYWDDARTQVATQPIRTINGYPVNGTTRSNVYVAGEYSATIKNENGTTLFTSTSANLFSSSNVSFIQSGTGAVNRTAQDKLRETVSVKDFGAVGDGVTNDTAAIQAALTYANSLSSGTAVFVPKGTYICSSQLTIYPKTILFGDGKNSSVLQFTHTGIGIKSTSPLNSSTAVYIGLRDIKLSNTSGASTDGGYVDVGGSFVDVDNVGVTGFKHSIIFDQTEVATVTKCTLIAGVGSGSCIWLANGNYTVGANTNYTNRITITANQLNAVSTAAANILDDGGVNHSIRDNNMNAGLIGVRASGVANLVISGNESEVHGTCDIYLADTRSDGTYVGPCGAPDISGNQLLSALCAGNVIIQNCIGGNISSNYFGQSSAGISLTGGAANKAAGIVIEGNVKLVTGTYKTAGPFVNGFSGPVASQIIRQGAQTYVTASQLAGTITATPASMEFITQGTKLFAANDDGTNAELVVVTATTGSTFTATFATAKNANYTLVGVGVSAPVSGTFSPTVIGITTAGAGTYTTQKGQYTRYGNCVYFNINLVWTAHTGTGNMSVASLPFKSDANTLSSVSVIPSNIALTAGNYLTAYVNPNSTQIPLIQVATGTTGNNLVPIDTAGELYIAGFYFTNDPY